MKYLFGLNVAIIYALTLGCASAPRATVELSEILDKQIKEMERSHEAFVKRYYSRLREDVDRFMIEEWAPAFLAKAVQNEEFRETHNKYYKVANLEVNTITFDVSPVSSDPRLQQVFQQAIEKAINDQKANWGKTMIGFGNAAVKEIEAKRRSLMRPIDKQEQIVLNRLRDSYSDMVLASMTIKGYLQSVVDVTAKQDEILDKTKLLSARNELMDRAIELNDATLLAMKQAQDGEAAIAQAKTAFEDANKELKMIESKSRKEQ